MTKANPFFDQNELSAQATLGVFDDVSNADYHGGPGLSSSALKELIRSPLHYKYQYIDGNRQGETAAMLMGTLVHTLVLEPDTLQDSFVVADVGSRNAKAYKELAAEESRQVILQKEMTEAAAMADAVFQNDLAMKLLHNSRRETSVYWDQDGRLCKCRPDIWRSDIGVIADLKTTNDASPEAFAKTIAQRGYHVSAEWYLRGVEAATGARPDMWSWLVVESSAPYAVQVYQADPEMLAKASEKIDRALETLAECERTRHWPAYRDNIIQIQLPAWAA